MDVKLVADEKTDQSEKDPNLADMRQLHKKA